MASKADKFYFNNFLSATECCVEAAKYFQIGEENIRRITREHKDESFVLWRNRRVFIRREAFEKFLDGLNEI